MSSEKLLDYESEAMISTSMKMKSAASFGNRRLPG
jgi:hypothetical protein